MKKIGDLAVYTFDEVTDRVIGKVGTPRRDALEAKVEADMEAYRLGEATKEARLSQNLTQEQLGEKAGIPQSQISRIETGKSVSFSSVSRVFKALGFKPATVDVAGYGKLALW